MKKLLIIVMCIGLVGCTTKEPEPQESATPLPTPEEIVVVGPTPMPYFESKINIDLYKADEYYPIVDGVVTYPDGTTEEFSNGESVFMLDGSDEYRFMLYEDIQKLEWLGMLMSKEEAIQENLYYYSENIGGSFFVRVSTELPDDYVFTQSNLSIGDIKDGVFGVEQKRIDGEIPYVVYRYSNYVPKGEKLSDSFRVVVEDKVYYIWRKAEYDELVGFDTIDNLVGRVNVLWWGILDGDALTPHVFSFLREQD